MHLHRQIGLTIGGEPPVTVRPLGLVLKSGSWQLVVVDGAAIDGRGIGVMELDQLRATRLTTRHFAPPADFDLADFWTRHTASV